MVESVALAVGAVAWIGVVVLIKYLSYSALCASALLATPALALRPFEATDADVAAAGAIEVEVGALTVERDDGESAYVVPSLVFNYGLSDTLEFVGEFELEKAHDADWELVDPGVFLKTVLRQGVMQGGSGFSLAAEAGALLPSTESDADDFGGEAIVIASGQLAALTYHLNAGGGVERSGESFTLWGMIAELPITGSVKLVSEVSAEQVSGESWERSLLLGFLYESPATGIEWDMAVRKGLTDSATDFTATFGLTLGF